ncbi:hypothetical protein Anas_06303 [Armadillidium nasatum]|uniref:C-type lectin domain-containing protein n=1 Tax=Armadillidium nasatum TaxID=96803 RepID=A0A5N5SYM4_9CRUS|nr:hypothetical protein Anas_06303 [Armadillidium nasatum]
MFRSGFLIVIFVSIFFAPGYGSQGCLKILNWDDANKYCLEQGGYLALPEFSYNFTTRDLALVYPNIVDDKWLWIGASSKGSFIQYKWVNGSELPFDHPNWFRGHPAGADDLCVSIFRMSDTPYSIVTLSCSNKKTFLCQFSTEH